MANFTEQLQQFQQFYSTVHPGRAPYQWQLRLLEQVADTGQWPTLIQAPTGAGKTSVIDVHIFLNAIADQLEHPIPRRMALVVGRRALVDSQYDYAKRLVAALAPSTGNNTASTANRPKILDTVWEGLMRRAGKDPDTVHSAGQIVHVDYVRGGGSEVPQLGRWSIDPVATTLYFMTPDMFGSQLLFSGYAVARGARPIAAALLAFDTVAVIDEAHMNQQLFITARRVPELDAYANERLPLLPLQVVASTATPSILQKTKATSQQTIDVPEQDLETDAELSKRLNAPKSITLETVDSKLEDKKGIKRVVELALELDSQVHGDRPTGIIVNSPRTAVTIAKALKGSLGEAEESNVATIIGRMRPFDRKQYTLTEDGNILIGGSGGSPARFVVATQTLEVGVDIDLKALITEIAPVNALIQRAGRVNRAGAREHGPIVTLAPPRSKREERTGIYLTQDLTNAQTWLESMIERGKDFTPWAITTELKELEERDLEGAKRLKATARRRAFQRPEWADAEFWSITSERTFAADPLTGAPANLDLWLSDSFESFPEVELAVRRLPRQEHLALQYLQTAPIDPDEIMPVLLNVARTALGDWLASGLGDGYHPIRAFRIDADGNLGRLTRANLAGTGPDPLRPGETIIVDEYAPLFTDKVLIVGGRDTLPDVSPGIRGTDGSVLLTAVVSLANAPKGPLSTTTELASSDIPTTEWRELAKHFSAESVGAGGAEADPFATFTEWVTSLPNGAGKRVREFMSEADEELSVDVFTDNDELVMVLRKPEAGVLDESERSVVTQRGPRPYVLLDDHQADVGARARELAVALGLPEWVQDAVHRAGVLHDEGKRDARFQAMLLLADWKAAQDMKTLGEEWRDLAKSRFRSRAKEKIFRSKNGLNSWRHEQLSAAVSWASEGIKENVDLVTRLVGTSHGSGRWTFDDGVSRLIPRKEYLPEVAPVEGAGRDQVGDAAVVLFDEGEWEALMERTNRQFGLWGVAFLEALLRLADQQISAEGR